MATNATARSRNIEIAGVAVNTENHVACMKSKCGIRMGGTIVEELVDIFFGADGGFALLGGYVA